MPSYEERSQQNKAEAEKVYYSAANTDNKSIQIGAKRGDTGRHAVIHSDGGVTSNGDKVFNASAPQDGFVRGNASGNAIVLEHRNISQDADIPTEEEEPTSNIIILFKKDDALYVGGDRAEPELVYELEADYRYLIPPTINKTGTGIDDYIINFVLQSTIDEDQCVFCVFTDNALLKREKTIPRGFNGNLLGTGFFVFQHGYFSSITVSDQILDPNADAFCSFRSPPTNPVSVFESINKPFFGFQVKGVVTFDVDAYYRVGIDGTIFPPATNYATSGNLGYVFGVVRAGFYGSSISAVVINGTIAVQETISSPPLEIASIDVSGLIYTYKGYSSPFGALWAGANASIIRTAQCPFKSTHRAIGFDVLNNGDLNIEYVELITGNSSPLTFRYLDGQTTSFMQFSEEIGDTGEYALNTRGKPLCVGIDQSSAIIKRYADSSDSFTLESYPTATDGNFQNVFSDAVKSPNLIDGNVYAVSNGFERDQETGQILFDGEVEVFTAAINGETVENSSEFVSYIGIAEGFEDSIIDASYYA
jgi:hypothetical protein